MSISGLFTRAKNTYVVIGSGVQPWARSSNIQWTRSFKIMGGITVDGNFEAAGSVARKPVPGVGVAELRVERSSSRMVGIVWAFSF